MNLRNAPARLAPLALLPAILFSSCSKRPAASQPAAPQQPQVVVPPELLAAPTPDVSTPKKASLAFANAVAAGDTAGMRSLAIGTDGHMFAFYNGLADVVRSQHFFVAALKARFGDDCEVPPEIEHIGNLPSMPSNYDQLTEQIDGDTAKLVDTSGHAGVRLKKVDGNWKVDLQALDAALPADVPEDLAKAQQKFAAVKKGLDQATAKILDGTYADCKSAVDAAMAVVSPQQ